MSRNVHDRERSEKGQEKEYRKDGKILLKGGRILDPGRKLDRQADLLISDGRVSEIGKGLSLLPEEGKTLNVRDLIVTPGLVDIHTHLFATGGNPCAWAGEYSVYPDHFSFRSGVTTMVDAGSAGWRNFDLFRVSVLDRSKTRTFAMINIASYGMISDLIEQHAPDFQPEMAAQTAEKHRDIAVAIKTAHYWGRDWASVDRALDAGNMAKLPVMVDFGYFLKERPYWQLVTKKLRPGDISTHCFRGPVPTADARGSVFPYLWEARERGVRFDLGHGGGSFLFRNAIPAIEQGFYPDSISSDLHVQSMNGAMMDMATTLSKCLAMGMTLGEVIARSTHIPAGMIGHPELGTLQPGAEADVAVWNLRRGKFGFRDTSGGRLAGEERLECELTLRAGEVVWDLNARDAMEWSDLPVDAGIRPGEYRIEP
ncbi:MAG: amidohydrolase/deacetylase family metallohydrolase [Synergistaceae bacterium]|jgi:dihydroorotase|nr:amidohydrolase/deacetylase family metallohydrolase [Synergistaceae bacterium]